jgi:cobalt-zinc-cadmium efflux system outer membrane protein
MRPSITMCALALGLLLPVSASSAQQRTGDSPGGDTLYLTRKQAILLALRANPQIDVAREQLFQAQAQRVQAVAIADPVFAASADSVNSIRRITSAPQRPIALTGGIPFPDKLRLRGRIGTSVIDVAGASLTQLQQQLAADAGRLYDSVLVVHLHQRNLLDSRELSAEFLKRTQARFNAGTVAKLDVIKAQVDLAQAENDLIASRRDVANADAALNRAIGRITGTALVASDSLGVPVGLPPLDVVEASALTSRPELTAIAAQQRGARAASTLVRENAFLPDLTLGAGRDLAVPSGITYSVGFSVPIPLLFWQHTRGEFAETHHRELELAATLRDARAAVAQDVRTTYATAEAALRQVVFLRDQLLPSAREAYRISTVSYTLGGLSALEVLDARRQLLSAQSQYAAALAAANSTRSDLERAAGAALTSLPAGANRE